MKTIFTTDQVAKISNVAPRTASKSFNSGRRNLYRIPGTQDRRIPAELLFRFLREHGMPLGEELMGKVLIVGTDPVTRGLLNKMIEQNGFKLETAQSGFEAGIQAECLQPDCVVIDFAVGRSDALMIAGNLRKNPEYAETVLIGLLSDEDNASGFDGTMFNVTFRKPFDVAFLADQIRFFVSRKIQLVGESAPSGPQISDQVDNERDLVFTFDGQTLTIDDRTRELYASNESIPSSNTLDCAQRSKSRFSALFRFFRAVGSVLSVFQVTPLLSSRLADEHNQRMKRSAIQFDFESIGHDMHRCLNKEVLRYGKSIS